MSDNFHGPLFNPKTTTMPAPAFQSPDDLEHRFTYHAPKPGQQERYVALREKGKELALLIVASTPPSAEQVLAVRKVEEATFWANAGIARNE